MLKMNPDAAVEYWQAFFPTAAKVQVCHGHGAQIRQKHIRR